MLEKCLYSFVMPDVEPHYLGSACTFNNEGGGVKAAT